MKRKVGRLDLIALTSLIVVTIPPFAITVNTPLLHDAYAHVFEAATETPHKLLLLFTQPSRNDLFFRPIGYLTYWLDFKWAGYNAFRWHLGNLLLHVINSCLFYLFAIKLSLSRFPALIGALIFAVHGSRPEVVCWTAASFDLLAAFFVLLTLLAFNRFLETRLWQWYAFMVVCTVLALLTKEAAYCLPLLILGMLPFKDRTFRNAILVTSGVLLAVCGSAFIYRYWVIGGVGGYHSTTGEANVLQFSAIHTLKGLFFRQWAFLFFPLNWSAGLSAWVKVSVLLGLLVMIGFLIWSKPNKKLLLAAIAIVLFADLPIQHLLLMTADLAGARVLYLPLLGIALFWGVLLEGCTPGLSRTLLAAGLLTFQLTALCHNLLIWRQAASLSEKTCAAIGAELARDRRAILIQNLPDKWHGVFFLRNGFPQCVAIHSHGDVSRLYIEREGQPPPADARVFSWNDRTERFQEVNSSY